MPPRAASPAAGREELMARYHARAGTLEWYSVDFWETALELDIMRFKEEVAHLIDIHPHVPAFLDALRASGRRIVLATNAHHKSVTLKMARTGLTAALRRHRQFARTRAAKEEQEFWRRLHAIEPFDPARTLLVDDSLPVLDSARRYGIAHLVTVKKPDTATKKTPATIRVKDTGECLSPAIGDIRRSVAYLALIRAGTVTSWSASCVATRMFSSSTNPDWSTPASGPAIARICCGRSAVQGCNSSGRIESSPSASASGSSSIARTPSNLPRQKVVACREPEERSTMSGKAVLPHLHPRRQLESMKV
jgi:HAD superfamily hydrolase (TIGR01509 family)